MQKLLAPLIALVALASCPPKPPTPPPPVEQRTIGVSAFVEQQPLVGCAVTFQIPSLAIVAKGLTHPSAGFTEPNPPTAGALNSIIDVTCDGYLPYHIQPLLAAHGNQDIQIGWLGPNPPGNQPLVQAPLTPLTPPLPPIPTRAQLATAPNHSMQGETFTDPSCGGPYPWWDPIITMLSESCRQSAYAMKRTYGDQMLSVPISWAYLEADVKNPNTGTDWTQDLPTLHARVLEAVQAGFYVDLRLAGDGESVAGGGYNDPVGHTYGQAWLVANFPRIYASLADLAPYIEWNPGYDAVFYGWLPAEIRAFGGQFRSLCTDPAHCVLALEHNTGHIPTGEGNGSFTASGDMALYDVLQSEFEPGLPHDDNSWQIGARLLGPLYIRPPDQPAQDDPGTPFSAASGKWYLAWVTPRGPYFTWAYEIDTYYWVRNRISLTDIQAHRLYLRALGWTLIG